MDHLTFFLFDTKEGDTVKVRVDVLDVIFVTDENEIELTFKVPSARLLVPATTENTREMLRFVRHQILYY